MKTILLILFAGLSLFLRGQTSVYHPFPDSNAVWNFDSYQYCGQGWDRWRHEYSIVMTGDTMINEATYRKLEVPISIISSNGQCNMFGTWIQPGYYAGSIRQDTAARKVYIVPRNQTSEQLLYDFNLQVGDIIYGYLFYYMANIVESIDSVLVGDTYRKRWNINEYYDIYFVEGIGSSYGLIQPLPPGVDAPDYYLTCFRQNDIPLFPEAITDCETITYVDYPVSRSNPVKIFPNPSSGKFILEAEMPVSVEIYNAFGMKVLIITPTDFQNSIEIDLTGFPKGMYLAKINGRIKVFTGKLILE
jgi:hypothetical protein